MRWRGTVAVAGVTAGLLAGLLTGCGRTTPGNSPGGSTTTTPGVGATAASPVTGRVLGTFQRVGGPMLANGGTPKVPLAGVISFRGPDGGTVAVTVAKSGKFTVLLAPGTYRVSGRTESIKQQNPDGSTSAPPCSSPLAVRVRAAETVRIAVVCSVP